LHQQGYTGYAIARQLHMGKSTVFRYLRTATFPERRGRSDRGRSVLDPYKPYLLSRWNAGCREALALFEELKGQGYPGSYLTVARYAQRLRQAQRLSARQRFTRKPVPAVSEPETPLLTPRRVTWLVLRRPDTREARDAQVLTPLEGQHPVLAEAMGLAQDFAQLVRHRQPDNLEPWLERAALSLSEAFQRFAKRLREDYDSVKAGVTLPWSNEHVAYCTSSPASWPFENTDPPAPTARRDRLWGYEHTGSPIIIARPGNPATAIPVPHGLFAHAQVRCDLRRRSHTCFP
jgi:transposase